MLTIKDRVTFFAMAVLVLIPVTLVANGIGYGASSETKQLPMIAENGCNIGLDTWYLFLTMIACFKLLIEILRYFNVMLNFQESITLHFIGNTVLMPMAFFVFFMYTQTIWEHSNPDPDHIMGFYEAQNAKLEQNICVNGDAISHSLYSTF